MSKKLYEETDVQALADAIRAKNGSTDKYKLSDMAGAIENVPTWGKVLGNAEIATVKATEYASYNEGGDFFTAYKDILAKYSNQLSHIEFCDNTQKTRAGIMIDCVTRNGSAGSMIVSRVGQMGQGAGYGVDVYAGATILFFIVEYAG